MITPWRIELFGGLRATQADRVVTRFRTQKTGLLLAYLALTHSVRTLSPRSHRRDDLAALLWPEAERRAGLNHLKAVLRWLRQELEPPGIVFGTVLAADRTSVGLHPETVSIDVADLLAALDAAHRSGSDAARLGSLTRAVELYQGELLPGYFEDWVLQERQWLAERFFQALGQLLALLERSAGLDRALEYARRGVSLDPLREEAHRNLMRLLAAVGQTDAARQQYRELERLLAEHLGAAPDAATRTLLREIERLAVLAPAGLRAINGSATARSTPLEGENRLVTLLSVGARCPPATHSRHVGNDASPLDRVLPVAVDVVLRYEGRIDRLDGEGILAIFGLQQIHEDDPERAIRAALEIREAAGHLRLAVRAGIVTGEVTVGQAGPEQDSQRLAAGPAVDLAVRLQQEAQPGEIRVGDVTRLLTRRAFRFTALSLGLPGQTDSEPVYAVERAVARPEKPYGIEGLRAELIGRSAELARLQAALAESVAGRGQMVCLIGEAGVGKSRLIAELKLRLTSPPAPPRSGEGSKTSPAPAILPPPRFGDGPGERLTHVWLEGRCLPLTMTAGYSVFVDLFRDCFAWRPDESETQRGERLIGALRELAARGELAEEQVEEIGPLLGRLLSLRFGTDWDQRLQNAGPEQIKHQTFVALREFLLALTRRQPLVLVLEDLHWADRLSLDLIPFLLEAATGAPMLLLCVYRPEKEHKCRHLATTAARKYPAQLTELHLRELAPGESRCLVASLLQQNDPPAAVIEPVLQKARGNPFFVEESIRALIESGILYRQRGAWCARDPGSRAARGETVRVPESIQSVIGTRVDRLAPGLKHVLQRAAVIGRLFRRRLLEQMVQEPDAGGAPAVATCMGLDSPAQLDSALWELEEHGLIYQDRVVPEEEFAFQHVLTQEAVYQSLLPARRALFHQQVGEAIEILSHEGLDAEYEQLAYHYERSPADQKAIEYLLKAGEKARRAYLNEEAIGYFQRAAERLEASPQDEMRKEWRLEALRGLGQAYEAAGSMADAETCFRQAIVVGQEIGLPVRDRFRLHFWLADVLFFRSRREEMRRVGEEGLALLGAADRESVEAALMNHIVAVSYFVEGKAEPWRGFTLRNAAFLARLPYVEELRAPHTELAEVYLRQERDPDEALRWLHVLEEKAEQHHDLTALHQIQLMVGEILSSTGDLVGAMSSLRRAVELGERIGDIRHLEQDLLDSADLAFLRGDLHHAEEIVRRALPMAESVGRKDTIALLHRLSGEIALARRRWRSAVEALERVEQLGREIGWPSRPRRLGCAYLAQRRRRKAADCFRQVCVDAPAGTDLQVQGVSGLEAAAGPAAVRALWYPFREAHPDAPFSQWLLEPTDAHGFSGCLVKEEFTTPLSAEWVWTDPFGDGSLSVENGLTLCAPNGRDLWYVNRSAPRLLRGLEGGAARHGPFAAQTICSAVAADRPAIGGLLLWKDAQNFLRLDRGGRGAAEISFSGCQANRDLIFGRGCLPAEHVFLRLECLGDRVNALCSADGDAWFTVGHAAFACEGSVAVGLHAIGNIDRTLYHGAYPEGTAIWFASFELWR